MSDTEPAKKNKTPVRVTTRSGTLLSCEEVAGLPVGNGDRHIKTAVPPVSLHERPYVSAAR